MCPHISEADTMEEARVTIAHDEEYIELFNYISRGLVSKHLTFTPTLS